MRTYKYGSQRLDHEEGAATPSLRWVGIRSEDIISGNISESSVAFPGHEYQGDPEESSQNFAQDFPEGNANLHRAGQKE